MKRSTQVIGFTYLLGMAACILLGSIPTALAGGYDEAVSSGPFTPLVAEAAETYWTPERRASALPVPLPEVSRGPTVTQAPQQKAAPGPLVVAPAGGPGEEVSGDIDHLTGGIDLLFGGFPFSYTRYRLFPDTLTMYKTLPYRTVGKLFFTIPGMGDFVCSGSVVNSDNRAVVWTAGHCVYSPGIGYHINFLFQPALRAATKPYGSWTVKEPWTLTGWMAGLPEYDHGALVMNLYKGKKIGNVVGWLGFVANAARGQHWHILGYPQGARDLAQTPPGPQFDGKHIEICATAFATTDLPSGNPDLPATNGVGCDQTGGTSGGPWVVDFSGVGGATNFLNGNNSYRYNSPNPPENLKLYSPYFGDGAVNLRNAAQAVPVP